MTHYSDNLRQGAAYFTGQARWNGGGMNGLPVATSPYDTQNLGAMHTQIFAYQIGTASTALASGVFYTTASTGTGTLTATGALVSGGVASFDVPRVARISASTNLATCIITLRGTDGYGQALTWQGIGPSGNTLGNVGSYVDTTQAFDTITTASFTGLASAGLQIGNGNTFGLPYALPNVGMGLDLYINGSSASVPGTWTAGFSATGIPTASGADVRGLIAAATAVIPNGTTYYTAMFITPNTNVTVNLDDRNHTYGPVPFSN